jgi:ribonuclease T2
MIRWGLALMLLATAAWADEDEAGAFDYYVLSLSWTPTWCALEGDARGLTQCDLGQGYGFTLHGLWPQYETGWPSYCADLPPEAPSFITRVRGSGFHILRGQFGQARRARGPQIAEALGALQRVFGCPEMSAV